MSRTILVYAALGIRIRLSLIFGRNMVGVFPPENMRNQRFILWRERWERAPAIDEVATVAQRQHNAIPSAREYVHEQKEARRISSHSDRPIPRRSRIKSKSSG